MNSPYQAPLQLGAARAASAAARGGPRVAAPIFIYHGFYRSGDELKTAASAEHRYFLPLEALRSHLDWLAQNGFHACSLAEWLQGDSDGSRKTVVLTFDDGHLSNYLWAWPLLRERGFTATFFIVADWAGGPARINPSQLREMIASGMSVGSHGLTHRPLTGLPAAALDLELGRSKEILEQMLGVPVPHFAVPGGFISSAVITRAQQAGYQRICSSEPGLAMSGLVLSRFSVTSMTTTASFAALAERKPLELAKTQATYFAIHAVKKVIGVANYERICRGIVRPIWRRAEASRP